ncbi:MAG: ATP-binding protein [Candidatus Treponema excrementipullorum]|uniref:ATP-binding protein n=1 Tax=Candidatus Treponema excrementipullorum TaxID=2838768 RepID=A0A9E2L1Q8_9SPIR|nr:ATP-binding protein [Candidatus Treponema excrementipullorum]
MIARPDYLNKLISKKENGLIKIITGNRRCGKSYLLFTIYHEYLVSAGIAENQIIELALDETVNAKYRNPIELDSYIRSLVSDKSKQYYVFLDEIQKVDEIQNPYVDNPNSKITFVDTVLGLMKIKNVDLYITGSNSKMLSSDILTEFRDRGDEIRVYPLSFAEFYTSFKGDKNEAWKEYYTYGGMPLAVTKKTPEEKSKYLKDLFTGTYLKDVLERHTITNSTSDLEELLNIISSSIGSLTNPLNLSNTFKTVKKRNLAPETISTYLDYFKDAFLIDSAVRYNIKGKKYISTPLKYYFVDVGLRNARLNFRQQEENHIMENIIFNELKIRGFDVDIGVIEHNTKDATGKSRRNFLEIDFVANKGSNRFYIQSALHLDTQEKMEQETQSLNRIHDSFKKIVVVKDDIEPWQDDKGIQYIGIEQFLLEKDWLR